MTADGHEGRKGWDRRKAVLVPFAALVIVLAIASYLALRWEFTRPGPLSDGRIVLIERGASLSRAARLLENEGVIRDKRAFRIGARLIAESPAIQAGEYLFTSAQSMHDVLKVMQSGQVVLHRLTVAEGITSAEVVEILGNEDKLTGEIKEIPLEGSLLPETYFFARGDSRTQVIQRMQNAMTEALNQAWRDRAEGLPLSSRQEALILASIIEKETAVPDERARISGVFTNRLRRGIRLQSDPTIIYGLTRGRFEQPITVRDLDSDTPYNTYRIMGLPPTPITNPGIDSIKAALNPLQTDELYFVADGEGGHVFAKTLAEHNENVRKWRRIEAARRRARLQAGENGQ